MRHERMQNVRVDRGGLLLVRGSGLERKRLVFGGLGQVGEVVGEGLAAYVGRQGLLLCRSCFLVKLNLGFAYTSHSSQSIPDYFHCVLRCFVEIHTWSMSHTPTSEPFTAKYDKCYH